MNWREYISKAYATYSAGCDFETVPVFFEPAPPTDIPYAEQQLGLLFPEDLRELLAQTNGFGEDMILKDGPANINLGSFFLSTSEIIDYTIYYRESGLSSNIHEMIFVGDSHVDGICFAIKKSASTIYAWYPSELVFRPLAPSLQDFIFGWLSGTLSI